MEPSTSTAPVQSSSSLTKVIVNRKQEGNPVLKYVRSVPYEWSREIRPDYICGGSCGVLYLALKWHKLHPSYLETRCNDLTAFNVKILLVLSNVEDATNLLRDLNMFCFRSRWTLIIAYSVEEAGEYIENIKLSEKKNPAQTIRALNEYKQKRANAGKQLSVKEKNRNNYEAALKFLSSIKGITASDAKRLLGSFGSIAAISKCTVEQFNLCPGLGNVKSQKLFEFFRAPLLMSSKK